MGIWGQCPREFQKHSHGIRAIECSSKLHFSWGKKKEQFFALVDIFNRSKNYMADSSQGTEITYSKVEKTKKRRKYQPLTWQTSLKIQRFGNSKIFFPSFFLSFFLLSSKASSSISCISEQCLLYVFRT